MGVGVGVGVSGGKECRALAVRHCLERPQGGSYSVFTFNW